MENGDPTAHLDEAAWEHLAVNQLTGAEREALLRHVLACADCSEIWKALLGLKRGAEAEGLLPSPNPARRPLWRSTFVPLALAATVVLAVAGILMTRQPAPTTPVVRGNSAIAPIEGLMMAYSAGGVPTLIWTPVPGAARYRLEIFSDDGRPLWSGEVAAPPAAWPSGAPRAVGAYRWRVEALGSNGAVARSQLAAVELPR